jgi:hypothetical protein
MQNNKDFPSIIYWNKEGCNSEAFDPPTVLPSTIRLKRGEKRKIKIDIHSFQAEYRRYVVRKIGGLAHPVLEQRRNKEELELLARMREADTKTNNSAPLSKTRKHRGVLD